MIDPEQPALVGRAASAAADVVLADRREFPLSVDEWDRFGSELELPSRDLPALLRGFELRARLIDP